MSAAPRLHAHVDVFQRIVVGVDGTEPGFEACRQAARLVDPDGTLELFSAVYLIGAIAAGWSAARIANELEHEAGKALEQAASIVGPRATKRLVNGGVAESLLHELRATRATLAAVGTHGHSRIEEIVIGGVTGMLLHEAPCSVLVARRAVASGSFPRSIVVGADGSAAASEAVAVAEQLAERLDATLQVVVAVGGKDVDAASVKSHCPDAEIVGTPPVAALAAASQSADLLVVGSRGLHGVRALGSISERVAHEAQASVLVVRGQIR